MQTVGSSESRGGKKLAETSWRGTDTEKPGGNTGMKYKKEAEGAGLLRASAKQDNVRIRRNPYDKVAWESGKGQVKRKT